MSSQASDESHEVEPFVLAEPVYLGWPGVRSAVVALPRTRIVEENADYLHAECTSALFRFVDDLELLLDRRSGTIAVRSASRVGYSDLGVNRERVESLREQLHDAGVIRE